MAWTGALQSLARRSRELRRDRGSSAIELAILAPALLILTLLVIQWALWFEARQVALNVAQEGARYARAQQANWPSQAVEKADAFYGELHTGVLKNPAVRVSPDGGAPNQVYVTVTGYVPSLIPGMAKLSVSETSGGDVECFRPPSGDAQSQCG
ncbi:MAG: TadE/TadG family type IV pilus assembly protein [Streptosporangiaceae bacterium]